MRHFARCSSRVPRVFSDRWTILTPAAFAGLKWERHRAWSLRFWCFGLHCRRRSEKWAAVSACPEGLYLSIQHREKGLGKSSGEGIERECHDSRPGIIRVFNVRVTQYEDLWVDDSQSWKDEVARPHRKPEGVLGSYVLHRNDKRQKVSAVKCSALRTWNCTRESGRPPVYCTGTTGPHRSSYARAKKK